MTITKQQLEDTVRAIVAENPEGTNKYGPVYVNPDNPQESGCLIGHALLRLGVSPSVFVYESAVDGEPLVEDLANGTRLNALGDDLDIAEDAAEWGSIVQRILDADEGGGRTRGKALAYADANA